MVRNVGLLFFDRVLVIPDAVLVVVKRPNHPLRLSLESKLHHHTMQTHQKQFFAISACTTQDKRCQNCYSHSYSTSSISSISLHVQGPLPNHGFGHVSVAAILLLILQLPVTTTTKTTSKISAQTNVITLYLQAIMVII